MPSYNTISELRFISKLGSWSDHPTDRRTLLSNYLTAAKNRNNWDGIDKRKVIAIVKGELWALGHPAGRQSEAWRKAMSGLTNQRKGGKRGL